MKQILIILCLLWGTVQAQTIGYLRYDSVKIAKPGGNAELIIENATKAVTGGVLTNTGNGRSAWVAAGGVVVSDSAWSLTGNSGTTAGTNFVGTTDNVDLVFKTNNAEVSRWNVAGALALGAGTDYGTAGLYLESQGSGAAPTWSTPPGVTSLAAIGAVANANGATISGNTLNLQPASASFGGVVTTGTQTLAGNKVFNNFIGLNGTSVASFNWITGSISSTGFQKIALTNTNAGTGAGVGALYTNDIGGDLQYYQGSSTNLYIADGAYIHSSGTGGFRFVNSGSGSKIRWSTSNTVGINTGAYLGWDADEFYHIAIPQAASTSAKTVLLYDTASGGYFSQISLDSIGSGGSGANTALSNLASVAINTSLISDANNTDDLGSASLMWRTAYLGTSAFVPLVIGGDGTTADLTFKTTTGVGTTGSFMDFLVGNNGAVRAMRINDVGGVGILAPTTIDANHGITIKSPTNTGSHGLKILALNESQNIQIGWGIIEASSSLRLTATSGGISLNTTTGVYAGGTAAATSYLQSAGSFATGYRAISALRTLDATDHTIECTANTFNVTLPTAVGITGRMYFITNSGAGTITVATTSSQTFVNVTATPTTLTLNTLTGVVVQSNGANWLKVSSF